jgi:hypothetical protein
MCRNSFTVGSSEQFLIEFGLNDISLAGRLSGPPDGIDLGFRELNIHFNHPYELRSAAWRSIRNVLPTR